MTVHAAAVAARLIHRGIESDRLFSNLKLQKLVVLSQSFHLYRYGSPLIEEPVQAWKNGPVVKPLYGLYKENADGPISAIADTWKSNDVLPGASGDLVDSVWAEFSTMSAAQLWKLTHTYGPWEAVYQEGVADIQIPNDALAAAWKTYKNAAREMLGHHAVSRVAVDLNVAVGDEESREQIVIGSGQAGFVSASEYEDALSKFVPSRLTGRGI